MNETEVLLAVLALSDKEIEAGETVPIEVIMKEFGVEAKGWEPEDPSSLLV
jgi:hypothetical protein